MEKHLMDIRGLGEYIGIRPQTIYNKINRGDFPIPYKKIFGRIRFDREDVDQFINKLPTYHNLKKN